MPNSGYSLDEFCQRSHGAYWSRRCASLSRGPSSSPDETGYHAVRREIGPSVLWRFAPGSSHPCLRRVALFSTPASRLLNGFRFLRIRACNDLSSCTCVWHIFMVSPFCYARRLALYSPPPSPGTVHPMMAEDALHVCSQLLTVSLSRLQRWHISAGRERPYPRTGMEEERSDAAFIAASGTKAYPIGTVRSPRRALGAAAFTSWPFSSLYAFCLSSKARLRRAR